ncbi:MAG TPA: hypothetical protein VGG10_11615 [Rhizomicrobium sp.]|jgi:hypothetical protein
MILGMSPLLAFHVAVSIVGIVTGIPVAWGFLRNDRLDVLTAVFLLTTVLTSATGFPLPPFGLDPARIVGIISLIALAVAIVARYGFGLVGIWRPAYVIGAVIALYLNVFVLIVQAFQKVPMLHALAPNGNEPPFGIVQGAALLIFIAVGYLGTKRFHPR